MWDSLKNGRGKSAGSERIHPERVMLLDEGLMKIFTHIFIALLDEGRLPLNWLMLTIMPWRK